MGMQSAHNIAITAQKEIKNMEHTWWPFQEFGNFPLKFVIFKGIFFI